MYSIPYVQFILLDCYHFHAFTTQLFGFNIQHNSDICFMFLKEFHILSLFSPSPWGRLPFFHILACFLFSHFLKNSLYDKAPLPGLLGSGTEMEKLLHRWNRVLSTAFQPFWKQQLIKKIVVKITAKTFRPCKLLWLQYGPPAAL